MFGFMRPDKEAEEYRALYARGCQFLRREYGAIALPFHGYEAVFLYACSLDAGLGLPEPPSVTCCRFRAGPSSAPASLESNVGQFCSALALLLAGIKEVLATHLRLGKIRGLRRRWASRRRP